MRALRRAAVVFLVTVGCGASSASAPSADAAVSTCATSGGACVPATDTVGCSVLLSYECPVGLTCCTLADAAGAVDAYVADAATLDVTVRAVTRLDGARE